MHKKNINWWTRISPLFVLLTPLQINHMITWSTLEAADRKERDRRRGEMRQEETHSELKSSDPLIRLEGLTNLAKSRGKRAAPVLIGATSDPDDRVRLKAIDLLGNLKVREAVPSLLSNLALNSSSTEKLRTIAALGEIGDPQATEPLGLFLKRQDIDREMRAAAIFALGAIGNPGARNILTGIFHNDADPEMRRVAGESLQRLEK
jgi:HEAT repeat protein